MLDDLPVLVETEDVHDLAVELTKDRRAAQDAVRHDQVALGDHPTDVDVDVREGRSEALDEGDERVEAVRRERVVLDVLVASVQLDREPGVLVVNAVS